MNEWPAVVLLYQNWLSTTFAWEMRSKLFEEKFRFGLILPEAGVCSSFRHSLAQWNLISRDPSEMTNFLCQYSKPIFCQFNIMFLLDRPTLTTCFHSCEKDTRFILYVDNTKISMGTIYFLLDSIFFFPLSLAFYPTENVETKCSISRYINKGVWTCCVTVEGFVMEGTQ